MDFSINWFKNKKKEELELAEASLRIELLQRKIQNEESKRIPPPNPYEQLFGEPQISLSITDYKEIQSPYMSVKLVNDVLIVVLHDGIILTKSNATKEDFEKIQLSKTLNDILHVISLPEIVVEKEEQRKEIERIEKIQEGIEILATLNDFDVIDNTVYIKGSNRSIPELVVNKFLEIVGDYYSDIPIDEMEDALLLDEEYQALKNFFLWCCLNPRAEVANDLYEFLTRNSFKITKQGFFVALRNVVTVHTENEEDRKLVEFVSNSYNKVKAVWRYNPSFYSVYRNNDGFYLWKIKDTPDSKIEGKECIGNLKHLYDDLPNMLGNRYTDAHTGTFDIRVGKLVTMPMDKCSWSTNDCNEAGLICSPSIQ